jgi:hypothetical protein
MNSIRLVLVLSLTLLAAGLSAQQQAARSAQIPSSHTIQAEAWQIMQQANQARVEAGAGPLQWDAALATAARQHCLRMAAEGPISHQYPGEPDVSERAAAAGASFSLIEENVAMSHAVSVVHDEWMNSPHHRENLLNPAVNRVGIAIVASRGMFYVVADYERIVPVLTQTDVEAAIAGLLQHRGVDLLRDATLARAACATEDGLPHSNSDLQPRFVGRWQGSELDRLPQALADKIATGKYRRASVGSCPPHGEQGAFTAYRFAVLLVE